MPTREALLSIVFCVTSITLVLTTTWMFMDAYYDYFAIIKANVQDTKTNLTNIFCESHILKCIRLTDNLV